MSETKEPTDVVVQEDGMRGCARCEEAMNRSPEIASWVLAVIGYQERRKAEAETNSAVSE